MKVGKSLKCKTVSPLFKSFPYSLIKFNHARSGGGECVLVIYEARKCFPSHHILLFDALISSRWYWCN